MTGSWSPIPEPPPLVSSRTEIGHNHVARLRKDAGLQRDEHVLDVGCGVGRTAIPLTSWLSAEGSYHGFDVREEAIDWCTREITSRYHNFQFQHIDLRNDAYNPSGTVSGEEFSFPYEDAQFDLVFLYSVFTHLLPGEFECYVREITRVLKADGRVLATFFLLTDRTLDALRTRVSADPNAGPVARSLLAHDFGEYAAGGDPAEWMVAYKEAFVRSVYSKNGLRITEPIKYGRWLDWATGKGPMGPQDAVVAYR